MNGLKQNIKSGLIQGLTILLVLSLGGISYAAFTGFTALQVTSGDSLTAQKWNDMVDAVQDEYSTSETLTNKIWMGSPVYRRVFTANPNPSINGGYVTLGNITNVTPVGSWSIASGGDYWYQDFSHGSNAISFVYKPSAGILQVLQVGWDDSVFSSSTFVFEYTKN